MDWADIAVTTLRLAIGAYLMLMLWSWQKHRHSYERDVTRRLDEAAARNFLRRRQ